MMMLLWKIAWRNLWRNPMRSSIIILSLTVGLWAGAFILAFFRGMMNEQVKTAISRQYSHLQIHDADYDQPENLTALITGAPAIAAFLKSRPEVKAISPRILVPSMAATAHGSAGVMILGIDPSAESNTTGLNQYLNTGEYFNPNALLPILIGARLQEKLQVLPGQKIILTFQNATEEMTAAAFRVAGIYRSHNSAVEETQVYVRQEDIAPLAGIGPLQVHEMAVLMQQEASPEVLAATVASRFSGLRAETWKQLSPELRLMIDSFRQYMYIIMGIILLALVFGIVNTMLMAVMERQRELGVLMAVGMNRRKVFLMIMFETLLLALTGCATGLPLAWITVWITGTQGINLSAWSEGLAMYGYGNMVYPSMDASYYAEISAMTLLAALAAAIYPARKSVSLHPAEAIRKI